MMDDKQQMTSDENQKMYDMWKLKRLNKRKKSCREPIWVER
jgi:hypothetical protein